MEAKAAVWRGWQRQGSNFKWDLGDAFRSHDEKLLRVSNWNSETSPTIVI